MDEIRSVIPHREPFLFVDRVAERGPGRLATEWRVPPEAEFLRGHYPGRPIVPGVLICESAFQAGALLCAQEASDGTPHGAVPVLVKIGDARFKRMVAPGETLRCEVELEERIGEVRYMHAKVTCDGELVLRVKFVVSVTAAGAAAGAS
jgi:3-hydroxyacyl-[acyl-carrier-protein] dehydratase